MPYRHVCLSDHSRAAHGVPDCMRLVPYDKPGVEAVDIQSRNRDAKVPAGHKAPDGGVFQMSSESSELHAVLLPEQRVSQQLPGRLMETGMKAISALYISFLIAAPAGVAGNFALFCCVNCDAHARSPVDRYRTGVRDSLCSPTSSYGCQPKGATG